MRPTKIALIMMVSYVFPLPVHPSDLTFESEEAKDAMLVADYVRFTRTKHVCVVHSGVPEGKTQTKGVNTRWALDVVSTLAPVSSPGCYVSVLPSEILSNNPQGLVLRMGQNSVEGQDGNRSFPLSPSHITDACRGLRVFRLLTEADQRLFSQVFKESETMESWLLLSRDNFEELLKPLYIPLNSEVTVAVTDADSAVVTLWEIYQISEKFPHRITPAGLWVFGIRSPKEALSKAISLGQGTESEDSIVNMIAKVTEDIKRNVATSSRTVGTRSSLSAKDFDVKISRSGVLVGRNGDRFFRRYDLTGLHIHCVTRQFSPLVILKDQGNGTVAIEGLLGRLLYTFQEIMNFTYTCHNVRDGQWGAYKNGKWNGMVKEVMEKDADMAVGPLDITPIRNTVVDYLNTILFSKYYILMKLPTNEDYIWTAFVKQLRPIAWVMVWTSLLILASAFYVVTIWSPLQQRIPGSDSAIVVFGFFCGQSTWVSLQSLSIRLVSLTALMLQVVLLAHYTSDLVSGLTAGPPLPPYSGLQDVYDHPRLKLGFVRGSSLVNYFKDSEIDLYRKIWDTKIEEENLPPNYAIGVERALKNPTFLMIMFEAYYQGNHASDCRVFTLPTTYFSSQNSFVLQKKSPLLPVMNRVHLRIFSSGLMQKWSREFYRTDSSCDILKISAMELKTLSTPFLLLTCGTCLAILILIAERLISRRRSMDP